MSDLFYDPFVLKVIRATLASLGVRGKDELEAAMSNVVLACVERSRRSGRPPQDVGQATAIALTIANAAGAGAARKRVRRESRDPGAGEGAVPDAVDEEKMRAAIRRVLEEEPVGARSGAGGSVPPRALASQSAAPPAAPIKAVEKAPSKPVEKAPAKAPSKERGARRLNATWIAACSAVLLAGAIAVYFGSLRGRHREAVVDRAPEAGLEGDRGAEVKTLPEEMAAGRPAMKADEAGETGGGEPTESESGPNGGE